MSEDTRTVAVSPAGDRRAGFHPDLAWAVTVGLGVVGGLLALDLVHWMISRIQGLLIVVVVSLFLSFAMEPAVQYLARRGMRRGLGTWLVFLAVFLLFGGFVAAMAPLVVDQISNLVESGPQVFAGLAERAESLPGNLGDSVSEWLVNAREELPARIPDLLGRVGGGLVGFGTTIFGGLIQLLTVALVTFYLVADGPKVRRALVSRLPEGRQLEVLAWWELAIAKTGGYVYSRVLTAIVSAAFHIVAFTLIGLDYPVALGVWVGVVSSVIPVVGTYIAGALPLVIALATEPFDAVWVLVAIIVYQQVENYLVVPRVTARTMELHPAVAFLSVLAGGALLGAVGALLALPVAAIGAALISSAGERHATVAHDLLVELDPSSEIWLDQRAEDTSTEDAGTEDAGTDDAGA